jgi:hypothetical protein
MYRCLFERVALVVIDYRQLISLTPPLVQFCVVWGQELHEEFMLEWVQVFCKVVCDVIRQFNVRYDELTLTYAISHPMKTHID